MNRSTTIPTVDPQPSPNRTSRLHVLSLKQENCWG